MISGKTIARIKEADLGEAIELLIGPPKKKTAKDWWWHSPFKTERTPSFAVGVSGRKKNVFKCFSSGCGGVGLISFLMDWHGISFPDAVKMAAGSLGIEVEYEDGPGGYEYVEPEGYGINSYYQKEWESMLHRMPFAMDYLTSRRMVSEETAKRFGLGFCTGIDIPSHQDRGLLVEQDILRQGKQGYYWTFNNRITFPFRDLSGRITGFYGRDITGRARTAHMNTKDTDIFNKSESWFGLYENWRTIRNEGRVFICEGQMDVVGMSEAGVNSFVCTGGSQFTKTHARMIKRMSVPRVILAYEGDTYRDGKLHRAVNLLLQEGVIPEILYFKPHVKGEDSVKHDPDWIRTQGNPEDYIQKRTFSLTRFASMMVKSFRHEVERLGVLRKWIDTFGNVSDSAVRQVVLSGLSEKLRDLGLGVDDIMMIAPNPDPPKPSSAQPPIEQTPWYKLIHLAAQYPSRVLELMDMLELGVGNDGVELDFGFLCLDESGRVYKKGSYVLRDSLLNDLKDHFIREGDSDVIFQDSSRSSAYADMVMRKITWHDPVVESIVGKIRRDRIEEIKSWATEKMLEAQRSGDKSLFDQAMKYRQIISENG